MNHDLVPSWSQEQLIRLALKLLKHFGHQPKESDIRDNGHGWVVIRSDWKRQDVATIDMTKSGKGHMLTIPSMGKSKLVDEYFVEPWIGGLNRCFRCCMTYFKSAVSEASLGRASKRPEDWLCGHPPFVASDDSRQKNKRTKIPFQNRLVDVLVCLNCSRIHYLLYSLGYPFQNNGHNFRLEDSGHDSRDIAWQYELLTCAINQATKVLPDKTLAALVADYLLPRDGAFITPSDESSTHNPGLTKIEEAHGLCYSSQVSLAHDGSAIFLDSSEFWDGDLKSQKSPIRLVSVSSEGSDTMTMTAYSPDVSFGTCSADTDGSPAAAREPRTNFEIPMAELGIDGRILWRSGPKYFEKNPISDDIKRPILLGHEE